MVAWDTLEARGLYKKVRRVADSFMPLVILSLSAEKVGWTLPGVRLEGFLNEG